MCFDVYYVFIYIYPYMCFDVFIFFHFSSNCHQDNIVYTVNQPM
jgi:hypothetical protein